MKMKNVAIKSGWAIAFETEDDARDAERLLKAAEFQFTPLPFKFSLDHHGSAEASEDAVKRLSDLLTDVGAILKNPEEDAPVGNYIQLRQLIQLCILELALFNRK